MTQSPIQSTKPTAFIRTAGMALVCLVFSFLGAWAALASGLVENDAPSSLTDKRNIVSQEGEVVADVAARLSPSVVSILVESEASLGLRSYVQQGAGTGIVISSDGYILTNRHVVAGASNVEVVLADGTSYENVEVVGSDPANDIAFLKIKDVKNLRPAAIGDSSQIEVGEKVIAIGNALGQYQTSVTSGIISGLGRPLVAGDQASGEVEQLSNLFQTDAAINPGNSGGPLVNLDGEVIGINTAVDQDAEGIGFAIPINDAKGIIAGVKKSGKVQRAFLGVGHVMITADIAEKYKLPIKKGAYVTSDGDTAISAGSPAAKAGIRDGDIITKVDGVKLDANYPLLSAISAHVPGDSVSVTYLRDGKEATVIVTLGTYPSS
jgi:serine protease Do